MAITDLTGTTWKLNPKSAVDTRVKFQINGSMYSDNYSVTSSGGYFLLTTSTFIFVVNGAEGNIFPHLQFYYNDNKWREWGVSGSATEIEDDAFYLHITDGEDVKTAGLITWLQENGEMQEEETPTTTVIKAGTYRFNDEIPSPIIFTQSFNVNDVKCVGSLVGDDGLTYNFDLSITEIRCPDDNYNIFYRFVGDYGGQIIPNDEPINIPVRSGSTGEWSAPLFQFLTFTKDTEVDEAFYTWFTENTQMLIEAGTYRWNDVLNIPFYDDTDFPFIYETPNSIVITDDISLEMGTPAHFSNVGFGVTLFDGNPIGIKYETDADSYTVYTEEYGWNAFYELVSLMVDEKPEFKGYGQIITITEDKYVPTNFGLWANENWQEYSEQTITKKFTRLYIGNTVATAGSKCFKRLTTEEPVKEANYLTFSSPNSFTLATATAKKGWDGVLEYSTDTTTWNEWDGTTTLSADNGVLYMRGTGNTIIVRYILSEGAYKWVLNGTDIACEGNIENLLDYATVARGDHPTMGNSCYQYMFQDCTSLITAPSLPAIDLVAGCYQSMFDGCTSLTTAPELPAIIVKDLCYSNMFNDCTSLTTAPSLPATNSAYRCYAFMFQGCTSLKTLPALPATTLKNECYLYMFDECANIKLSSTQTGEYQTEYKVPTSGTGTEGSLSLSYMFTKTGGTFTGTPSINTTYYTSNTVI